MAKEKTIEISIIQSKGAFSLFKKQHSSRRGYTFTDLSSIRHVLSNEKARMLDVIKNENPLSIYDLAKKLGRGFKSVSDDVHLLKKFGFVILKEQKTKNRKRLRPMIVVDSLVIHFNL
ncbi:MAG: hypothetical protein M1165_02435 [Candidatus Pacearchaeota archaeon]|nr:hypothetical protein [Candidatus Pacearchaeota archaeon]